MKKLLPIALILSSVFLVSCGQKNLDNIIVTPDTPIENRDQTAKVCAPVIEYITCSIEKAPEAGKEGLRNALKEMQRRIENDKPSEVAQQCNVMIQRLTDVADEAFKNGCFVESAYTQTETPKEEVAPPAPVVQE